jgi:hypothetical protein
VLASSARTRAVGEDFSVGEDFPCELKNAPPSEYLLFLYDRGGGERENQITTQTRGQNVRDTTRFRVKIARANINNTLFLKCDPIRNFIKTPPLPGNSHNYLKI